MSLMPTIVFENSHLIAVDKPSGFLSVPSRMGVADTRPVLGIILQEYVGKTIFPVHRLDEETSGIILFAKTSLAQKILSRGFETHTVQKTYEAITGYKESFESLQNAVFKNKLVRGKKRSFEADHGQYAETLVTNVSRFSGDELLNWTLLPKTGRSHQLRVQLAMRGFPIAGDQLYGSQNKLPPSLSLPAQSLVDKAIGLRAIQLDLTNLKDIESLEGPTVIRSFKWGP